MLYNKIKPRGSSVHMVAVDIDDINMAYCVGVNDPILLKH